MSTHVGRLRILVVSFLASLALACGNDSPPDPPDSAPVVDSADGVDGPSCGGATAFLQACTEDDQCTTCQCEVLGHVMACTHACGGPADCEAPSTGCAGGFCQP
jgi:hypothetical protein